MLRQIKEKFISTSDGIKSAGVYTMANLLSRGLAIITVPLFTRIMTSAQIGEVSLYNSWYSLLSVIATLSLTSGGFSVAMKEYENDRDAYVSSVLTLSSLVALLFGIVFAVAPNFWCHILGMRKELIILMIIGFLFAPARDFWLSRQRYEYKYKLAALVTVAPAIIATAASIIIVLFMNKLQTGDVVIGRLFANYAVIYGVAAIIWVSVFVKGKTFFNKTFWKFSLALSVPLIGHSLASQVLSVSDRLMISRMIGDSEVGIYSTIYSISSIIQLFWGSLNSSFIPFLYKNIDKEESRKKISNVTVRLIVGIGGIAVLCSYFAPEIIRILATEEYYSAIYIMPPIVGGVFMISIANIYSNVLLYFKKSIFIMLSTSTAAVVNIILNLICIPRFGYMAAAYTTLISYIVMALMEVICENYLYKKNFGTTKNVYDNKKLLIICILIIALSMLGLLLYNSPIIRYIVIFVILVSAASFVLIKKRTKNLS